MSSTSIIIVAGHLSVSELALIDSCGILPIGQVMGASTYKIGWQFIVPNASQELTVQTQAHAEARRLALGRLQQEARLIGADGVVGVRVEPRYNKSAPKILEYHAFGTAVRLAGPNRWKNPFIAPVSIQELWALQRAGHFPIGYVFGGCIFYHVANITTQYLQGLMGGPRRRNSAELTDYTRAVKTARRKTMGQIEFEAQLLGADGVIGVTVDYQLETREVETEINERKCRRRDVLVHFTAFGTAIMPAATAPHSVKYIVGLE